MIVVSESAMHCHLAVSDVGEGSVWQRKATHLVMAEKQGEREKERERAPKDRARDKTHPQSHILRHLLHPLRTYILISFWNSEHICGLIH